VDSNKTLQQALEPVLLYRVDAEKGDGKTLAKEFKIRGYPTFIMVNQEGQIIDLWLGYSNTFIPTLADACKDLSTIDEKKARFKANPDLRSSIVLGRYSSAMGEFKEAEGFYQQAQALNDDSTKNYYYDIFENTANGVRKDLFTYDDAVIAADKALSSSSIDPWDGYEVSGMMITLAKSNNKPDDVAKYIQAGLDVTSSTDNPTLQGYHSELNVEYALNVEHDTALAVQNKRASMPENWQEDAAGLNEFAWWCFENQANLNEAEQLADKALTLAKPGREKANILDTAAEIKHTLGKSREAIELEQQACNEAPEVKEFSQKVEKWQGEANSGN
jgi:tetratricopeptide (TPR) repeat protein